MTTRKILAPAALLLGVTACVAPPKYNWGNYSNALVTLDKDPTTAPDYEAELAKIVNNPDGHVPPGIYAEYGFALQQRGDTADAAAMYAREKAAWPESAALMNKMLAQLPAAAATPATKPVS